jgi:hypothetical protein
VLTTRRARCLHLRAAVWPAGGVPERQVRLTDLMAGRGAGVALLPVDHDFQLRTSVARTVDPPGRAWLWLGDVCYEPPVRPRSSSPTGSEARFTAASPAHPAARATLERAPAIKEAAYGPDHPEVAITLDDLGNDLFVELVPARRAGLSGRGGATPAG